MPLVTDYFSPEELTDLSRSIQADGSRTEDTNYRFQRDYLPSTFQHDVEYRVRAGVNNIPTSARFRAWDAQNHVGAGQGFTDLTGELLPLGERRVLTELDRLQLRRAGDDQYRQVLAQNTRDATLATIVRIELAAVNSAWSGKTTITNERGVTQEADWGRSGNRVSTAANLWTNPANANPIADMENVLEAVDRAGRFVMNRVTARMIKRAAYLRNLAATNMVGTPDTITDAFTTAVLADRGITVEQYNARYTDDKGSVQYILPTGRVLFIADGVGQVVFGVTREAMDMSYGIPENQWPGIVAGHRMDEDPIQDWINVSAVALPVITSPDNTYALTVA